jgi:hypothetical protein
MNKIRLFILASLALIGSAEHTRAQLSGDLGWLRMKIQVGHESTSRLDYFPQKRANRSLASEKVSKLPTGGQNYQSTFCLMTSGRRQRAISEHI